jgi:hypothetical protein
VRTTEAQGNSSHSTRLYRGLKQANARSRPIAVSRTLLLPASGREALDPHSSIK